MTFGRFFHFLLIKKIDSNTRLVSEVPRIVCANIIPNGVGFQVPSDPGKVRYSYSFKIDSQVVVCVGFIIVYFPLKSNNQIILNESRRFYQAAIKSKTSKQKDDTVKISSSQLFDSSLNQQAGNFQREKY